MLGIDIGGTKLLFASVKDGKIVKKVKYKIKHRGREEIVDKIVRMIKKFKQRYVGIGVPGIVRNGRIVFAPNLRCLNNFEISKFIEKECKVKVKVDNDANCFALGEYFRWKKSLVGITIGTGVGGGIVIDGSIYHGRGSAGEVGHMIIEYDGKRCSCGCKGCWEEYVSKRAFERESKILLGKKMEPKEIYLLAKNGNEIAIRIFNKIGKFIGVGLANIVKILDPELIVIGGGISKAREFLIKPIKEELKRRLFIRPPKIVFGREDSVAFGAAMLWKVKS